MFQGSCDSTWILVLRKDYLHQGRIKIYSSRLEPETRPINLLLHCIISLMREQRQVYSPIYGELAGTHLHPLESVWQDHPAFPRVGSSMSAFFCLSILSIKARTHILNAHIHAHTHAHSLICIRTHSHTLTHSYTRAHTYRFTCTHAMHTVGKEEIFFSLLCSSGWSKNKIDLRQTDKKNQTKVW